METISIPREDYEVLKTIADTLKQIVANNNESGIEQKKPDVHKIYTFKEAAKLMNMNVKSLYEMAKLGHIKPVQRTARHVGISHSEIEKYFRSSAGEQLRARRR